MGYHEWFGIWSAFTVEWFYSSELFAIVWRLCNLTNAEQIIVSDESATLEKNDVHADKWIFIFGFVICFTDDISLQSLKCPLVWREPEIKALFVFPKNLLLLPLREVDEWSARNVQNRSELTYKLLILQLLQVVECGRELHVARVGRSSEILQILQKMDELRVI